MRRAGTLRKLLSLMLTVLLGLSAVGVEVVAATQLDLASLAGRIVLEDRETPLEGATLIAAHVASDVSFESPPTDAEGRFGLADLPAGAYRLAVRDGDAVYPLGPMVSLAPGPHDGALLALAPASATPAKDDEDEDDDDRAGFWWNNPLSITVMALAGLTLLAWGVDEIDNDDDDEDEDTASPSFP